MKSRRIDEFERVQAIDELNKKRQLEAFKSVKKKTGKMHIINASLEHCLNGGI